LFNARAVGVAAPAAGGSAAASSDVASAMIDVAARQRGAAIEALERDRMTSMIAWAKRASGRERRR
jgi:hypothetical protein